MARRRRTAAWAASGGERARPPRSCALGQLLEYTKWTVAPLQASWLEPLLLNLIVAPVHAPWLVVSVIVHSPVTPTVEHGFGAPSVPGPEAIENVTCVPAGAFTNPEPGTGSIRWR